VHEELALVHVVRQAAWSASTYGSTAVRVALRGNRARPATPVRNEERLVFVVGSPRSGTTFVGRALGSQPGFVDLGEVPLLKAIAAELAPLPADEQALRVRQILQRVRSLGLVRRLRGVEQTPEMSYLLPGLLTAYPTGTAVHVLRDGRDVVCSLLERGWLSANRGGRDDAHQPYGAYARFWVEHERREEFEQVSDARRAAWAWRRYVTAARSVPERTVELRYEALVSATEAAANRVAEELGSDPQPLRRAFASAHAASVGRWRNELSAEQLADVEAEAGGLLAELGYR
jgi:Sulfotransferase family